MADFLSYDLYYFFVFVFVLQHGLRHSVFCIIFVLLVLFYIIRWTFLANIILLKSMFTSYYFVLLIKQTTEVKSLSLPHVTQFQNCRLAIPQTVSGRFLTAEACVLARIISFGFVTQKKNCQWCRVSPGIFPTPVVILIKVLHTWTMTTVDAT